MTETFMGMAFELMVGALAMACIFVLFGLRAPAESGGGCGSCAGDCGSCPIDAEVGE